MQSTAWPPRIISGWPVVASRTMLRSPLAAAVTRLDPSRSASGPASPNAVSETHTLWLVMDTSSTYSRTRVPAGHRRATRSHKMTSYPAVASVQSSWLICGFPSSRKSAR